MIMYVLSVKPKKPKPKKKKDSFMLCTLCFGVNCLINSILNLSTDDIQPSPSINKYYLMMKTHKKDISSLIFLNKKRQQK